MTIALLFDRSEDMASPPLFARRAAGQCAWPLWDGSEPLHAERCCGAPTVPGKPYCTGHEREAFGRGSAGERRVDREAREFILKGIGYAGR